MIPVHVKKHRGATHESAHGRQVLDCAKAQAFLISGRAAVCD